MFPSFPARPRKAITINSLDISKTVIQTLTLPITVKPINIVETNILSAIVSRNAPVLEETFHFLASFPSVSYTHLTLPTTPYV